MVNDVSRAFFEAPVRRHICVELPEEELTEEDRRRGVVGKLRMSLYGTRDASVNFQQEVRRFMVGIGFRPGGYNPCTYYHKSRKLRTFVCMGTTLPQ